jgi:hypothetical protein
MYGAYIYHREGVVCVQVSGVLAAVADEGAGTVVVTVGSGDYSFAVLA